MNFDVTRPKRNPFLHVAVVRSFPDIAISYYLFFLLILFSHSTMFLLKSNWGHGADLAQVVVFCE